MTNDAICNAIWCSHNTDKNKCDKSLITLESGICLHEKRRNKNEQQINLFANLVKRVQDIYCVYTKCLIFNVLFLFLFGTIICVDLFSHNVKIYDIILIFILLMISIFMTIFIYYLYKKALKEVPNNVKIKNIGRFSHNIEYEINLESDKNV